VGGEGAPCPHHCTPFLPSGPCSCWNSTQREPPASARSLGNAWRTAAWGGWRSSCRGRRLGLGAGGRPGHQDWGCDRGDDGQRYWGQITGFGRWWGQPRGCPVYHVSCTFPPPSFQQRVERFHENPGIRELPPDSYISRTIALVNCGPPLR
jgi:hypothetical protein